MNLLPRPVFSYGPATARQELMMARVEIYTKFGCPYCARAKRLLDE